MTQEKIGFWDIVKTMEPRWVMSSMATGAVGMLLFIVGGKFGISFLKVVAGILGFLAILFFILFLFFFILRIIKFPQEVKKDLTHPIAANFFAGIFISAAVIVSVILNVLKPLGWCLFPHIGASIFYYIALFAGITIAVLVPFMLTISENVDPKHAIGIWFLPPVGLFVLLFAGNFMYLNNLVGNWVIYFNTLLFGVAFILYFLVLSMVYSRLKFFPLPAPEVAPSFVIGLAPVGVSIIALNTYYLVLSKANIFNWDLNVIKTLIDIISSMLAGFGIWWFIVTFLIISYYLIKKSLPYTLGWWAFVFPVAAFGIGFKFLAMDLSCQLVCYFVTFLALIASLLWIVVFYKTLIGIITKKAFIRPKVVK